jgi:uncharacterized protein (DUF169 family)
MEEDMTGTQVSVRLKEVLELDGSPVAMAYVTEQPSGLEKWSRPGTVCIMVQKARRGNAFYSKG